MNTPEINDGGPAFPTPDSYDSQTQKTFRTQGMTLRDWFAGQALAGMAASSAWGDNVSVGKNETRSAWMDELARHAFVMADTMLAKRNKK